jgi:hypothetical protein
MESSSRRQLHPPSSSSRHRRGISSRRTSIRHSSRSIAQPTATILGRWQDYLPTDWILMIWQPPTPYHPQVGDEIVYFRQGHEAFLKDLDDEHFYQDLPWIHSSSLSATVFGIVTRLEFRPGRPPYCILSVISEDAHEFCVTYFDRVGVSDFIILRSRYEQGMRRRWKPGMNCKAFFDDRFYCGVLIGKEPIDKRRFPDSPWESLCVEWTKDDHFSGGGKDYVSPWELHLPGIDEATAPRPIETLDSEGKKLSLHQSPFLSSIMTYESFFI